tara:strand:+ start:159 stop:401 length:243 start_codon:yes stop_codon:yes gene_type:complete
MNVEHLIQMANQIGAYFETEPDRAVARAGIADHLARFWEKRMRQTLYEYLDKEKESEIDPLVNEALIQYRGDILGISRQV